MSANAKHASSPGQDALFLAGLFRVSLRRLFVDRAWSWRWTGTARLIERRSLRRNEIASVVAVNLVIRATRIDGTMVRLEGGGLDWTASGFCGEDVAPAEIAALDVAAIDGFP